MGDAWLVGVGKRALVVGSGVFGSLSSWLAG